MPTSAHEFREARTVTLANGDRFHFSFIEPESAARLVSLAGESASDRDYVVGVLTTLLVQSNPTEAELADWPDTRLLELAVGYLNLPANKGQRHHQDFAANNLSDCRKEMQSVVDGDIQRLTESSRQVMDSITKNAWKFGLTLPPIESPLIELMRTSPILQFEQVAQAQAAMLDRITGDIVSQAQMAVNRLIDQQAALSKSIQQMAMPSIRTDLLLGQVDFSQLMPVVDTWSVIQRSGILETLAQVPAFRRAALLLEADLEFLNDLVDEAIDEAIDEAASRDRRYQQAYVGRCLRDRTADPVFWQHLEQTLTSSPRARRRLAVLQAAHRAHQARQYELSVPTLYTQVEGLLADSLAEAGKIRWSRKYRHWIVIDPDTGKDLMRPQKNWKSRPDTVKGLDRLTALAKKEKSVTASKTVAELREGIASVRNQVMHGTKTNYGTARNSSRLLLITQILVHQLQHLETAKLDQSSA